jgi:hypothetical protein
MAVTTLHDFRTLLLLVGSLASCTSFAATPSVYDPYQSFAPLTLPEPVNLYRSSNGAPGPGYWQNAADYTIHASLNTESKLLTGDEVISYTNNSPDRLDSLWIQLDENVYRKDARSVTASDWGRESFTDGFVLDAVEVESHASFARAKYVVSDTRMQVRLPQSLAPHGAKLRVHIHYHYTIPGSFGDRTSWVASQKGDIYDIAQWYPRMAVYDDLHGWDTQPYLMNEFYLEYGNFDYYITVPSTMVVAGSGELQNAEEVLAKSTLQRLDAARASDQTVVIRSAADIDKAADRPAARTGTLTWHFRMQHTRDVSFSASDAFLWDAARIQLPDGGHALGMSFYPVESAGPQAWGRSTEYLKHAVEEFSRRWLPYPYPVAINVAGGTSGMEYPGILFDGIDDKGKDLFWITAHEIGHTWFPMIVGFNERRNAWMDEGFNTFIDVYESDAFDNGVYGPKRDSEYAPGGGNPVDEILPTINDPEAPVIMTRADAIQEKYRHPITYYKSALGLILLREQILGPERFDWAFRKFIRDWAFKHPAPSDFFRAMESEGGEDLAWFWRGWYFNNWTLDLAVQDVRFTDGEAQVTLANRGRLVMPSVLDVVFKDGTKARVPVPVETWIQQTTYTLKLGKQPITSATIDPDHVLPDNDRSNNHWSR